MVRALTRPESYPHPADPVEHLETHISHVFLAGDHAYKIKKPLDLGFLDFSTLARRRQCCEEELRLNRRLAPELYLDVVPITGTPTAPRVGASGPVLEYAVHMVRFASDALLTHQPLSEGLMDALAEQLADFHARIPIAVPASSHGTPAAVLEPMIENLTQIRERPMLADQSPRLDGLEAWTRTRWLALRPVLERRRRHGHIRECHGDAHRGNIVLIDGAIRLFDALEFSPALRWIDTASEIAFLIMDIEHSGALALARRFLNRYLERSGDYGALEVLDVYKVYRALVRAKVSAIRLGQAGLEAADAQASRHDCLDYLALAESYTEHRQPRLLLACGLSGSGKSYLARQLRERMPLIHLRSDMERKRLFGVAEAAHSRAPIDAGVYFPAATDWTYGRLLRLADAILCSGYDVLVDATFIKRSRRARFRALAQRLGVRVAILVLDAPLEVLRERIQARLAAGEDVSDATLTVLERQRMAREPLTPEEQHCAVDLDTSRPIPLETLLARIESAFAGCAAQRPSAGVGEKAGPTLDG
nr:bifunctional aminoglycoside phosphotransferase/ATP-binding protein [Thiocapsa imhoffii]